MSKSVRERLNAPLINLWIDWFFGKEWIGGKGVFAHDLAIDQMLLDNFLKHVWSAGVIPDTFWINDGNRAIGADAQAIDFAPIDQRFRAGKIQLFEPPFQIVPGFQALLFSGAMRFGLIGA